MRRNFPIFPSLPFGIPIKPWNINRMKTGMIGKGIIFEAIVVGGRKRHAEADGELLQPG